PNQGVQPGGVSAHAPARLVGYDPFGLPHRLANALIDRLAAGGGAQHDVNTATTTERDTEKTLQAAGDLAVRQAGPLVEFGHGGSGMGRRWGGGGAEGVGRLQGMASLHPAVAPSALADVDVELPVDGLARDLDLELLGDVCLVERAAAAGAAARQRRLVDLVDLFGGRRVAGGLGAVVLARLAPRGLGGWVGLALGEGPGLALAGAEGRVELTAEPLVLGLQVVDPSLKGLAVGTPDCFHAGIIRSSPRHSGAVAAGKWFRLSLGR